VHTKKTKINIPYTEMLKTFSLSQKQSKKISPLSPVLFSVFARSVRIIKEEAILSSVANSTISY
jgi:hypothetical protein